MRKTIIRCSCWAAGIICLLSAAAFDSECWLPLVAFIVSGLWLLLVLYANTIYGEKNERENK